jgi:hypothetical protein
MDAQAQTLAEQVGKTMYAVDTATKDTMGTVSYTHLRAHETG